MSEENESKYNDNEYTYDESEKKILDSYNCETMELFELCEQVGYSVNDFENLIKK